MSPAAVPHREQNSPPLGEGEGVPLFHTHAWDGGPLAIPAKAGILHGLPLNFYQESVPNMNTTNVSQKSIRKSASKVLVLCLLAAIAAAFLLYETAQAQEGAEYGYVDLVMTYEYDAKTVQHAGEVAYSVQNNGTATATGVTVSFLLEDLHRILSIIIPQL